MVSELTFWGIQGIMIPEKNMDRGALTKTKERDGNEEGEKTLL